MILYILILNLKIRKIAKEPLTPNYTESKSSVEVLKKYNFEAFSQTDKMFGKDNIVKNIQTSTEAVDLKQGSLKKRKHVLSDVGPSNKRVCKNLITNISKNIGILSFTYCFNFKMLMQKNKYFLLIIYKGSNDPESIKERCKNNNSPVDFIDENILKNSEDSVSSLINSDEKSMIIFYANIKLNK